MSTFTIRITSSSTNPAGTAYGQQPDLGTPSFLDMVVSNSTDPFISDGVYDAYCLNPLIDIGLAPTFSYSAENYEGNTSASFVPIGFSALSQTQVDQLNWLLAQNFTSDPKFGGQFNFGEVQTAIWKIVGFTDAQINGAGLDLFLNDNNRNVVSSTDSSFLISAAQTAIASGNGVLPTDAFFTTIIDPAGEVQPLIVQLQSAKLGNFVWSDSNANGIQDSGEVGINSVVVELYDQNGVFITSTITGDDFSTAAVEQGFYQFTGLKSGDYQVKFITPAGQFLTAQDANSNTQDISDSDANVQTGLSQIVTLAAGESNQTIDAGLYQKASLGDYVWIDSNNNGQQDDGIASGLNGVTVNLIKGGNIVATTVTANNGANPGYYLFNNLIPGDYQVQFIKPAGYSFGKQDQGADGSDSDVNASGLTVVTTLTSGENDLSWDAGLVKLASLGDFVWVDSNANGVQDSGETGKADVTVELYTCAHDADGNEIPGTLVATQLTGGTGAYNFTDLLPGDYIVKFIANDGSVLSTANIGGNDLTDSDANSNGLTGCYDLVSGQNEISVDAGFYQKASLGDYVWIDSNNNGQQDDGIASGLNGVTVNLIKGGNIVATTVTANNGANPGYYLFNNLIPGDYQVEFIKPAGYSFGKQDQGADSSDSDVNASGLTVVTTLTSGENDLSWDAGLVKLASIGNRIWFDNNANGIQDSGEAGVANVTVELLDNVAGGAGGNILATTTTDANGFYLFNNLTLGDYHIDIQEWTLPTGYEFTTPNVGSDDAIDSDVYETVNIPRSWGVMANTTLSAGEVDLSWDAGIVAKPLKASIGDYVWKDCDGDGIQDATESGVAGVTVKLLGADGSTVLKTTTTDASGKYLFNNLDAGNYAVQVVTPNGYKITAKDQGSNNSIDSDVDQVTGKTAVTNLVAGENDLSWDAGLIVPANCVEFNFNGSSYADGTDGNIRTYTVNGISVNASAFSRTDTGTWSTAFLGSYSGGLGVTDSGEGSGSGSTHTLDNYGRDNYVLFEFNQSVVVDKAYLGYVVGDSDMQVWIGTTNTPFSSHLTLTDAILSGMGFMEVNATTLTSARWAELNANGFVGNTVVIAADTTDTTPNDYFKIQSLSVCGPTCANPKANLGDFVWEDTNYNGIQDSGEKGISNVTVKLLSSTGTVLQTTTTDANGKYGFQVDAGSYKVQVVKPSGYYVTKQDQGSNNGTDSDLDTSGTTGLVTVAAGEQNLTIDAGLYRKASVGDKVWDDMNHNNIQDASEPGIGNITVKLLNTAGGVLATTTTNASGNYLFSNLDPGSYVLQFDKTNVQHYNYSAWNNMSNWKWAVKDTGTNDTIDSDVTGDGTATTNVTKTSTFTLTSGQNDMTKDAGITPIVIDLNGDGIHTVSRANSMGTFDLLGNGSAIKSGWLSNDDGFLALDSNNNGLIDNISELFGGLNKGDGFSKLAGLDSNLDGVVDLNDNNFASLKVWQDVNGNHQTDDGELMSLSDAGVSQLNVNFTNLPFLDAQGNLHFERSSAVLDNGNKVDMTDIYFNVSVDDAATAGIQVGTMFDLLGETMQSEVVYADVVPEAADLEQLVGVYPVLPNDALWMV